MPGTDLLPDAAGIYGVHGLALGAAEGFAEFVEVLDGAVDTPLAGRVWIDENELAGDAVGLIHAPHLSEANEVALGFSVVVDFVVDGFALCGERVEQGHVGDAEAAIVGGVFAEGEVAVEVERGRVSLGGGSFKSVVFAGDAFGALLEGFE